MRYLFAEALMRIASSIVCMQCARSFYRVRKFGCTRIFIVLLLFSLAGCRFAFVGQALPIDCASISPVPPAYVAQDQGEVFDVEIKISTVESLQRCEFTVAYNSSLLNVVEVIRGSFFPPDAALNFENNESCGFVTVNLSVSEGAGPLSGDGTLARFAFEVADAPIVYLESILKLVNIQLYNPHSELIDHKSVSAIFFWRSLQPKEPDGERSIDLYTQKGGEGLSELGGNFTLGEIVNLFSRVTYADWPQQGLLVAFQAINPLNDTKLVLVAETDENGIAHISFRIPELSESVGLWTAISTVDIACEIVWDTTTFQVDYPVGGSTLPIEIHVTPDPFALHIVLIAILVTSIIAVKHKHKI